MNPPHEPAVKICGLTSAADARAADAAGARYLGVVLAPGGKRSVSSAEAAALLAGTRAARVGVFVDADEAMILAAVAAAGLGVVQLHGSEPAERCASLRARGLEVWKAVRPRSADEFRQAAAEFATVTDALLLDGWSDAAPGGTGARFPWAEIAPLRDELPAGVRLVVAGGLHPRNVGEAVALLRPDVVDVSSGVERAPCVKDHDAVREFVRAARLSLSSSSA